MTVKTKTRNTCRVTFYRDEFDIPTHWTPHHVATFLEAWQTARMRSPRTNTVVLLDAVQERLTGTHADLRLVRHRPTR